MLVRRGLRRSRVTLTDTIFAGCPGPAAPMGRGQLHETGRAGTSVTGPRGSRVPGADRQGGLVDPFPGQRRDGPRPDQDAAVAVGEQPDGAARVALVGPGPVR